MVEVTPVSEPSEAQVHASKGLVGGKSFGEYVEVFKVPLFVVIAWSVLGLVLSVALGAGFLLALGWVGIIVGFCAWFYCGLMAVKKHGFGLMQATLAGGIGGLVARAIGGLMQIVLFYFVPSQVGALMGGWGMMFGVMASSTATSAWLVTLEIANLVFGLFFGALLAAIGAFVALHLK